jgi:hypothetical protein
MSETKKNMEYSEVKDFIKEILLENTKLVLKNKNLEVQNKKLIHSRKKFIKIITDFQNENGIKRECECKECELNITGYCNILLEEFLNQEIKKKE